MVPMMIDQYGWLLAQEGGGGDDGGGGMLRLVLLIGMITVLYIFMMVLPQRREQKRAKELMDNLKKNDRVVFAGGICGTVANVHQDGYVTIRIDDANNTKLRVKRYSITEVITESDEKEDKSEKATTKSS